MRWFTLLLIGCVSVQAAGAVINVPGLHGPTIQAAIDVAVNGDEIIVAPGTYPESIDFLGKAITVRSSDPTDPAVVMNTIIDGTGFFHVVLCVAGEGPETLLSGFVITGGNANGGAFDIGGGMLIDNSSPTVTNCSFIGNTADNGGGMFNRSSSPTVINCPSSANNGDTNVGGMNNIISGPTVTNCSFSGNSAANVGGGMVNEESGLAVTNCSFSGNAALEGGGMYNLRSGPTVTNCSFSGNSSVGSGGGMFNAESGLAVTNCSFSGNSAGSSGGGMYNLPNKFDINPTVTNSGFCNNTPNQIGGFGTWIDGGGNSLLYCPPPISVPPSCPADINTSGTVNVTDLLALLAAWGACP